MNRPLFFDALRRSLFGGRLNGSQVVGLESLLDAAPAGLPSSHLAYCLATAFHETARTMRPIREFGGPAYFHRMYDPQGDRPSVAKALGNVRPGDGALFAGRGFVQLTGRSNYARAARLTGEDLIDAPDLALRSDLAARILFEGMSDGWFTGRKLSDHFATGRSDPIGARRIVNGTDRADLIAGYHQSFASALAAGGHGATTPPDIPGPAILVEAPRPASAGFFARLLRSLTGKA